MCVCVQVAVTLAGVVEPRNSVHSSIETTCTWASCSWLKDGAIGAIGAILAMTNSHILLDRDLGIEDPIDSIVPINSPSHERAFEF